MTPEEALALDALIELIDNGVEFPEAVWKISQKHGIDSDTLSDLYDESNC